MAEIRRTRFAVIGGGLSGLVSAYYLQKLAPWAEVHLFEASERIGGVIQTEYREGWIIEHGADCFSVNPPDALQLCRDLGIEPQLISPCEKGRGAMVSRGSKLYPVPEGFVLMRPTKLWQTLLSPLLSLRGKIRLALEPWIPAKPPQDDESLASFVTRRLGREAFERLVEPLVAGIYTADAEKLSMRATMEPYLKMEAEYGSLVRASWAEKKTDANQIERHSSGARYGQFRVLPRGMGELFESIHVALQSNNGHLRSNAEHLQNDTVHCGAKVVSIRKSADSTWQVSWLQNGQASQIAPDSSFDPRSEIASAAETSVHTEGQATREGQVTTGQSSDNGHPRNDVFAGVIVALPAAATAKLLSPVIPEIAEPLEEIPYASSAIVLLGVRNVDVRNMPDAFGFVIPEVDQRRILAASFASHKFPDRAPTGHTLIRIFLGGSRQPELLQKTDEELTQIAVDEMRELIGLCGTPVFTAVQRWNQAMPQYHVGHRKVVAQIEALIAEQQGLEIAGNAFHGVGIAPVVGTARRAAERLVTNAKASQTIEEKG